MTKKYLLLFINIFLPAMVYCQADVNYSQFYESSILRNPALTGVFSNNYKISAYYRNQWKDITNPFQTIQINGEYRFSISSTSDDFISLGLSGYNDEAGDLNQKISGIYAAINYNKSISSNNNSYLSFGFAGGYMQYSFDPSKATFNTQFLGGIFNSANPSLENIPTPQMSLYDIGAGINYNFSAGPSQESTYIIGVSGYHFTQPVFSYYHSYLYTENIRLNANASLLTQFTSNILFQLHANYARQGTYNELICGGLIGWQDYEAFDNPTFQAYAGVLYRYQDAVIPVVKLKFKHYGFAFSYDVNVSALRKASYGQGGFEMTAYITGDYPPNRGTYRKTVCPRVL